MSKRMREAGGETARDLLLQGIKQYFVTSGAQALATQLKSIEKSGGEGKGLEGHDWDTVEFVLPGKTGTVSSTGEACALDCAHCGGHFLKHMYHPMDLSQALPPVKSWLISGGSDSDGQVVPPPPELLYRLRQQGPLNLHVGLLTDEMIDQISDYADVVSFDLIGSDETIRNVIGIDATADDYWRTYRALSEQVTTIPHIIVGLDGGTIKGEWVLLDRLRETPPKALVFLVLWPIRGTRFAQVSPPSLTQVFELFRVARRLLPTTKLHLGCMRPVGQYRAYLDLIAGAVGFDLLVQPTAPIRRLAKEAGLSIKYGDQCCSFFAPDLRGERAWEK